MSIVLSQQKKTLALNCIPASDFDQIYLRPTAQVLRFLAGITLKEDEVGLIIAITWFSAQTPCVT